MQCEFCGEDCQFQGTGQKIVDLVDTLMGEVSNWSQQRFVQITVNDWKLHVFIKEDETLIGEITIDDWHRPQDAFEVKRFYGEQPLSVKREAAYVLALFREIKLYYDNAELQDGYHPVFIKININLSEKKNVKF